jgi:tetratricopeptide (TPR) repeat protein
LGVRFVGRVRELWEIHRLLEPRENAGPPGVVLITGLAGLGKTQLAIEYVHRFGRDYPGGVYWVEAESGSREALIRDIAEPAGIAVDGKAPLDRQVEQLWRGLNRLPPSLLVFDNFPEQAPLEPWLPVAGNARVLVTTKRRDLAAFRSLDLPFLNEEEALALLNSGRRRFSRDEARPLLERLAGLPLGIELARGCLDSRPALAPRDLVREMDGAGEVEALRRFAEEYRDELPSRHQRDVAATFQLSWNLASEAARQLLRVMAGLAPVSVPREILRELPLPAARPALGDPLEDAIDELVRLSLVERDASGDPLAHRLVLAFVRLAAPGETLPAEPVRRAVARQLSRIGDEQDSDAYQALEKLAPHAAALLASPDLPPAEYSDLASDLGRHLRRHGRYALAAQWLEQALASAERNFEPGHPMIAVRQSNLALVLKDLGRLEEARELLEKALASLLRRFGPDHPKSQTVLWNLASLDEGSGRGSGA